MLQRCFKGSARLLTAAEASCGQAAVQTCRPSHAKAVGEGLSCSYPTVKLHSFLQDNARAAATWASSGSSASIQCKAGGFEDSQQAFSRCLSSASCRSFGGLAASQHACQPHTYHRTYIETLASEHTYTSARTFAKASRLAQPASRAARKVAQRLPAAAKQAAAGSEEGSSGQSDVTGQEGSLSDAVVTQAETTRASDVQVSEVVDHPALIITREIEWGTVILGFEQANRYTVLDQNGNVVALLAEDLGGLGKAVGRQLLRTRRAFTATVFSPDGNQVIFRVRRPMYLINSTIIVEDGEGNEIGEVKQRWHLWKRKYDLYFGRRQFADIQGNFLAWEFVLRDENGGVLALIDRNFQGFGKELFTDAGKYVIHFGQEPQEAAEQVSNTIAAAHPDKPRPAPPVTALAKLRTDVQVVPTQTGNQLEVVRPLQLDERMIALAAAISIDFDYFSQHSHGPGMMPGFLFPMPIPTPDSPPPEPGDAPADGAAIPGEEAATGGEQPPPQGDNDLGSDSQPPPGQDPLERDLGGDSWEQGSGNEGGGGGWGGFGGDEDLGGDGGGDGDGGGIWDLAKDFFGSDS